MNPHQEKDKKKYTKKQFKAFMKIADNPITTFRQKAEEILGKRTIYSEVQEFKEQLNKWYQKQK